MHLDEARYVYPQQLGQQLSHTSTPVKSSPWKVQSPSRSKSTPFVYSPPRVADFTQDEQGELFRNPAFSKFFVKFRSILSGLLSKNFSFYKQNLNIIF
jgi:hypothetical protein